MIEYYLAMLVFNGNTSVFHFQEYRSITKMRLSYITEGLSNPSHFTVLVRGIPWSQAESYSETVAKFFTTYYASSYLSHKMVYRSGTVQKLMVRIKVFSILWIECYLLIVALKRIHCRHSSCGCFFYVKGTWKVKY